MRCDLNMETLQGRCIRLRIQQCGHLLCVGNSRIPLRASEMKKIDDYWGDQGVGEGTK